MGVVTDCTFDYQTPLQAITAAADWATPIVSIEPGVDKQTARILRKRRSLEARGVIRWSPWLRDWEPVPHIATAAATATRGPLYAAAAITGMVSDIGQALEGERNRTVYEAAIRAGRLIESGWVVADQVVPVLQDAGIEAGLGRLESRAAVRSGLKAGARFGPIELEERTR